MKWHSSSVCDIEAVAPGWDAPQSPQQQQQYQYQQQQQENPKVQRTYILRTRH